MDHWSRGGATGPELGESREPKGPVPGDAKAMQTTARFLTQFGQPLTQVGSGLRGLDHSGWTGGAADAFYSFYDEEPKRWTTAGTRSTTRRRT